MQTFASPSQVIISILDIFYKIFDIELVQDLLYIAIVAVVIIIVFSLLAPHRK